MKTPLIRRPVEKLVRNKIPAGVTIKARRYWTTLMSALENQMRNPKGSEAVLKDLLTRYSEPHRGYHNLAHIVAMLDELELIGENDSAVALAIWFHDAVYDPKAKDNEERSAELAKDSIKQIGLPDSLGEQVNYLIMATKHTAVPTDHAAQVLVDIDLMVLGKPEKEFDAYEVGIRKEYEWVPQHDFCVGRSKILQSFLDRPSIYSTELFRNKYESAARKNLERSIEQLRK